MRAVPRTWRPVPSTGPALGLAIAMVALVCTIVLLGADIATESTVTRVACTVGAIVGAAVFLTAALGAWWCWTLRYTLGPAALEVRYGSRLLRLRYDEIDEVTGLASDESRSPPTLWPGAHLGRSMSAAGRAEVWRGTTREPVYAVLVSGAGVGHVVTPSEARGFRDELIQNARSASYVGPQRAPPGRSLIDVIASVDLGVRALLLTAGVVGTVGIAADVARFGASQRDGIGAATILFANGLAAMGLSFRWPVVARLLAAGAFASQLLSLF